MLTASVWADVLLILILLLFAVHVRRLRRKGELLILDPLTFFWAGALVIYFVEPATNFDLYVAKYGAPAVQEALFAACVGLVALNMGYGLRAGDGVARALPRMPTRLSPDGLLGVSILLMVAGGVGWKLVIDSGGGLMAWASVSRGGADWENLSGYVNLLASVLPVGVSLAVLAVEIHRRGILLRIVAWAMLGLLLLFFLYLGSRSRTIMTALAGLLAWSLPRRRNPSGPLLLVMFVTLLLVVNFQAQYRSYFKDLSFNFGDIDWSEAASRVLPPLLSGAPQSTAEPRRGITGSEFDLTVAVVSFVPDRVPYALGQEFLQFFTHPVPRAWWPDKRYPRSESWTPIHAAAGSSTYWVDHVKVPFLAGPAPGFIASWYYNGGLMGLIFGGLLTGMVLRTLRGFYGRDPFNQGAMVIYSLIVPVGFYEAVSHPFNWLYSAPLIVTPIAVLMYMSRDHRRTGIAH